MQVRQETQAPQVQLVQPDLRGIQDQLVIPVQQVMQVPQETRDPRVLRARPDLRGTQVRLDR